MTALMTATCRILSTANVSALSHAHFNNNVLSIHSNGAIATGTSFMDTRSCLYGFKTRCHWLPRNLLCKIYQPTPPPTEIWPVSRSQCVPKRRKSTDHDRNLISSEGGQDTSACKNSAHSSHVFSRKCPETSNWPVKRVPKQRNPQTMTII